MPICRILLCGAVSGRFQLLLKRLAAVNEKSGPFDALICAGPFFNNDEVAASEFVEKCTSGLVKPPCDIYLLGGDSQTGPEAVEASCRLQRLGNQGISTISGLQVVFCNGDDVQSLISEVNSLDGDVDILVTSAWPRGILRGCRGAPECAPDGLAAIANLAHACRPRYHVSTAEEVFFQREPYRNKDLGAGEIATRFISLAAVGNAAKAKWIHALALEPAASIAPEQLSALPEACTQSPYLLPISAKRTVPQGWGDEALPHRHRAGSTPGPPPPVDRARSVHVKNLPFRAAEDDLATFFAAAGPVEHVKWGLRDGKKLGWALVQFPDAGSVPAAVALSGQVLGGRELTVSASTDPVNTPAPPLNLGGAVKDCWFCLSNADADVHLIVDVLDGAYIALDKGPISSTHCLIVSIEHYPNSVTLQPGMLDDVARLMEALRKAYASKGLSLVGFERYLAFRSRGGNHCHLNFLGVPSDVASKCRSQICSAAKASGFAFKHVGACSSLREMQAEVGKIVGTGQYFQVFLPDSSRLVHAISREEKHPMHFGREVLAKMADAPGRADWKVCKATSAAGEEEMTRSFRNFYQPFSPNCV